LYRRIAHYQVDTDGRTISDIADEIVQRVRADAAT
jgi:hypothetical protein